LDALHATASRPISAQPMRSALVASIMLCVMAPFASANAQAQAPVSFAGKQLSVALGYGTGGTYYAYAKFIADHLGQHVEGKPNVLVQSMPGAGGVRMLNSAAKLMAADGTQLFMPPDTMVISQTISKEGGQFDARKFHYLATINQQNNVFVTRREVATKLDDLKTREIVVGHSGIGSAGHIISSVAKDILGLKLRLIPGYEGSRDGILALERGEIDGAIYGWETWEQAVPHWFKGENSFAVAIFQTGPKREPSLPDVPLLRDMATGDDRALVELTDTQVVIGRSIALPPNASKNLVAQLRGSVAQMVADPAFKEDAARRKLILNPLSGEELQAAIERALNAPSPALIARAKKLLQ